MKKVIFNKSYDANFTCSVSQYNIMDRGPKITLEQVKDLVVLDEQQTKELYLMLKEVFNDN
ncbi:Hypothetical protein KNT65_gp112 [Escherichia phage EcS1]|uniref:Uncharacterized protein n=1 Tax=Escherichia phage EcS1 TaxID=2083276 RepID=A0A2Z5ZC21_9CAUD|nr:Hypothetical protein KNT65_gp112 [Escherichia phage EcS1]BBC78160.1 Hypothetical protein [Escherichia phage EcS1]